MKNLTVLAVAFAAGLTTFAASAKDTEIASVGSSAEKVAEKAKEALPGVDVTKTSSIGAAGKSGKKAKAETRSAGKFGDIIARYASSYGIPESLAHAVITVESNYRADARGAAGEVGLMQIKPATARMMGFKGSTKELFNPETNIKFGMKYLAKAHELGGGTTCGTILKYNAGHGAKRMNKISAAYCSKVKKHLAGA